MILNDRQKNKLSMLLLASCLKKSRFLATAFPNAYHIVSQYFVIKASTLVKTAGNV